MPKFSRSCGVYVRVPEGVEDNRKCNVVRIDDFKQDPTIGGLKKQAIKNGDDYRQQMYYYGQELVDDNPGRKIRAGSGRKAPEVTGTWKQYSNRKIFGFFPMISDRFLLESTGN